MYSLGVDLGTTFTAAGTWRDGRAEVAPLGSRGSTIPSVVLLREDGSFLVGEAANRRALTEPQRVARQFKRRLGDPTPILLAGVPYSAEKLMACLLQEVVTEISTREGDPPTTICVCHPANWGPYKTDLLRQAVRMANLEQPVSFITEPEAAAVSYAHHERLEPGAIVAVYDLGGGTFDAAVLRKTQTGFAILGRPEGIERLGGMDFDAAVFDHVARALAGKLAELDEEDPAVIAAVGRLREECVEAKECLSSDTDVTVPVLLPNLTAEVRLTRAEFEAMVRPALYESIEALRRSLQSAGVSAADLHSVLLVGGSSRMPVVAQLVAAEVGRPVAVDVHPKYAVALGAAWVASGSAGGAREVNAAAARTEPADRPIAAQPTSTPSTRAHPTSDTSTRAHPTGDTSTHAHPTSGTSTTARSTTARPTPLPSGPLASPATSAAAVGQAETVQAARIAPPAPPTAWSAASAPVRTYGPASEYRMEPPTPRPRFLAATVIGALIGLLAGLAVLLLING